MDNQRPRAQAVAVRGGVVLAVGSDGDVRPFIGPATRVVELAGRTATPGLVDGHCHLSNLGVALDSVVLQGSTSAADAAGKVAAAARQRPVEKWGEWLVGRGWDHTRWTPQEFPHHSALDAVVADRPVAVSRVDGHALWVNKAALTIAGISRDTADPPGGRILRDDAGEPTGVLIDAAMGLVRKHIPAPSEAVQRQRLVRAAQVAIEHGLTGVHEMGIDDTTVAIYRELVAEGALPLRVTAYLAAGSDPLARLSRPRPDEPTGAEAQAGGAAYFTVRGVKLFTDGALGSRGASLMAPYSDEPGHRGLSLIDGATMKQLADVALQNGWQLATHAIGDAGNRVALDAYAAALAARPGSEPRFRVEHAQIVAPEDLARFGELGILASMQPTHATSDMRWAEARVGPERIRGAYAWRSILESGGRIVAGSDFPVEGVSPLLGIYAAVTRQDAEGQPAGGWYPGQRMTLDEAVRSFTVEPAYAGFLEERLGILRPGHAADLTVFDRALAADRSLLDTKIDLTIVGGRVVFERR